MTNSYYLQTGEINNGVLESNLATEIKNSAVSLEKVQNGDVVRSLNLNFVKEYHKWELDSDKAIILTDELMKEHYLTKVDRVEATCEEDGNIAHYHCDLCEKNFSDENATEELTDVVLEKLGHSLTKVERLEPTKDTDGNIEYYHCSICGKNYSDETAIEEVSDVTLKWYPYTFSMLNDKTTITKTENGLSGNAVLEVDSPNITSVLIYVGVYEDEILVRIIPKTVNVSRGKTEIIVENVNASINKNAKCTVKSFLWSNTNSLQPLSENIIKEY